MIRADRKESMLKRLQAIEGQVRGLQKMVEEERPCVEVMTQIASVHEALRSVGKLMMRNYLETCATRAIRGKQEEVYDELMEMIYKFAK